MNAKKVVKAVLIAAGTLIGVVAVWTIPAVLADKDMKDVW